MTMMIHGLFRNHMGIGIVDANHEHSRFPIRQMVNFLLRKSVVFNEVKQQIVRSIHGRIEMILVSNLPL